MKTFIQKHPFWFALAFTVIVTQLLGLVVVVIGKMLGIPIEILKMIAAGATTIVALAFVWWIGWWKDSGLVGTTQNVYALIVPLVLMFIPLVFYGTVDMQPQRATILLLAVIFTGISEEVVFRGLFGRAFLPYGKWQAILVPAVLFAAAHSVQSLGGGMPLQENLSQIANAFFTGVLYGAVRLRINNIWPLIIIHALKDLFWVTAGYFDGAVQLSAYLAIAPLVVWLPSTITAIYLSRKPVTATIDGQPVDVEEELRIPAVKGQAVS